MAYCYREILHENRGILCLYLVYVFVYLFTFCGCFSFSSASIRSGHSRCFLAVYGNDSERLPVSNCFAAFENVVV